MSGKCWPAFRRREMRKGKVIHVFAMKAYGGRVCMVPRIINLAA